MVKLGIHALVVFGIQLLLQPSVFLILRLFVRIIVAAPNQVRSPTMLPKAMSIGQWPLIAYRTRYCQDQDMQYSLKRYMKI